jgi:ABC-type sugar transport system ATPase subunit
MKESWSDPSCSGTIQVAADTLIPVPPGLTLTAGSTVTLGIRPEHLVTDTAGGIPATVHAVEQLGDGSFLYATVHGSDEPITVRADPERPWKIGQTLTLGMAATRMHVFDRDGLRCRAG